ncbi:MAG: hypothetical protein AB7S75_00895 [Desulfococcaceae bacterium]
MLGTYQAVLKNNHLEWLDDFPFPEFQDREMEVLITVLCGKNFQSYLKRKRVELMAKYLERIAEIGGIKEILDPLEWQSEIRKDRDVYNKSL